MRLLCNDFKIRKFVKGNCKILCIYVWVFFFFGSIYEFIFLLYFIKFKFANDHPKNK